MVTLIVITLIVISLRDCIGLLSSGLGGELLFVILYFVTKHSIRDCGMFIYF